MFFFGNLIDLLVFVCNNDVIGSNIYYFIPILSCEIDKSIAIRWNL